MYDCMFISKGKLKKWKSMMERESETRELESSGGKI
jgi:hypothetical protein